MNPKTSVSLSGVAIAALVLLFVLGPIVSRHQALAFGFFNNGGGGYGGGGYGGGGYGGGGYGGGGYFHPWHTYGATFTQSSSDDQSTSTQRTSANGHHHHSTSTTSKSSSGDLLTNTSSK